jgi:Holliday junction resolvase-like predicted endonuclease
LRRRAPASIWNRRPEPLKGRLDRVFRAPGEATAALFLEARGHLLLRHNYHVGFGEIDLITLAPDLTLHGVEVKRWAGNAPAVHPLESFSRLKLQRMARALEKFCYELTAPGNEAAVLSLRTCCPAPFFEALERGEAARCIDLIWVRESDECEWFEGLNA